MRRTTAAALAAPILSLFALTGCSDAQDALDQTATSAGKARDCIAVAEQVTRSRLGAEGQLDEQDVSKAADELSDRAAQIEDTTLREAVQSLQDSLERAAQLGGDATPAQIEQARDRAVEAARRTADECGIPLERFTG